MLPFWRQIGKDGSASFVFTCQWEFGERPSPNFISSNFSYLMSYSVPVVNRASCTNSQRRRRQIRIQSRQSIAVVTAHACSREPIDRARGIYDPDEGTVGDIQVRLRVDLDSTW